MRSVHVVGGQPSERVVAVPGGRTVITVNGGHLGRVAYNPKVTGSNPVPATIVMSRELGRIRTLNRPGIGDCYVACVMVASVLVCVIWVIVSAACHCW